MIFAVLSRALVHSKPGFFYAYFQSLTLKGKTMTDTIHSNANKHSPSSLASVSDVALRQQEAGCARLLTVAPPTSCGSVQFATVAATITAPPSRILRLPEVMTRVGLKRASIYQHIADGLFPKQIVLGIRAVGWLESEIDEWLSARIKLRTEFKKDN